MNSSSSKTHGSRFCPIHDQKTDSPLSKKSLQLSNLMMKFTANQACHFVLWQVYKEYVAQMIFRQLVYATPKYLYFYPYLLLTGSSVHYIDNFFKSP